MRSASVLLPGSLNALTGGTIYDRRIVEGLRSLGWQIAVRELESSFPDPTARALDDAAAALSALPDGEVVLIDGLACGAMPGLVQAHATRLKLVALVHLPLSHEFGLDDRSARRREAAECQALRCARAIVATGRTTVDALARMGQEGSRVTLVEPGCDPAPLARGSGGATPHLLCVAALVPGKGHEGLLRALASVEADFSLTCVGSASRERTTADRLSRLARMPSLAGRVTFTGELEGHALDDEYDRADVFALNTLRETYGMAVSEAIARGLPVVSTRSGAIPDIVGPDGGVLVVPGDEPALRAAVATMLEDSGARARWRNGAVRARARLQTWPTAVAKMADTIERVSAFA